MGLLHKDKNVGLSEQQRLQKAQFEAAQFESRKRLEENLPGFTNQYNLLIERFGLIHVVRYQFDPVRGLVAYIAIQDCHNEVETDRIKRAGIIKEKNGIIK